MARTIQSPGVELRERDQSQTATLPAGTSVFIAGFASQGPTDAILTVSSIDEFRSIYGTPTTAAERYFYYGAADVLQTPGRLTVARLPYGADLGDGFGNNYSALLYPVYPMPTDAAVAASAELSGLSDYAIGQYISTNGFSLSSSKGYYFGEPTLISVDETLYNDIVTGNITWNNLVGPNSTLNSSNLGNAGLIVLNKSKTAINENFEGYYVGIADNTASLPGTPFNSIVTMQSVSDSTNAFFTVPTNRLDFSLSSSDSATVMSVSQALEGVPTFDITPKAFNDTLMVGVFRVKNTSFSTDSVKLNFGLQDAIFGSLDATRTIQSSTGGAPKSFYVENLDDAVVDVQLFVNPNISQSGSWLDVNGVPTKKVRVYTSNMLSANLDYIANIDGANAEMSALAAELQVETDQLSGATIGYADSIYPSGVYIPKTSSDKVIGSVTRKIQRVYEKLANEDLYPIDIVVDAGLSTINTSVKQLTASGLYNDMNPLDLSTLYVQDDAVTSDVINDYHAVISAGILFAEQRRDLIYVGDMLRHIGVQANRKVGDDKSKNFSQHVYWPLRLTTRNANTSYGAMYANWYMRNDPYSDKNVWLPTSSAVAAVMARSDSNFFPWYRI